MAVSGENRPLDGSLPQELTSMTPFPSLKLYVLIGTLSLSALSMALLIYLCIRLSWTSKKHKTPAEETKSRPSSRSSYEVFLSFRGPDTRHGFTDFLYHRMVEVGILVFRDSESLHVGKRIGDELLQAIENSKIYVPIFSENYASSHWCLRELAYMIECTFKSDGKKEILPIFLDVEPNDVKLKTNLYRKALSKHQKKFCTEVESWKKALIKVDEIRGWNWKKDEGQADLTRSVIETVLDKLNVKYKKIVTENLIGVDHHVKAIIKKLDVRFDSVQFLGIHGMGGIGKTTLAKVIFNKLSSHFQGYNFLSDVGESSRRYGLVHLQKQLLSKFPDSRSSCGQIYDMDDGINMIKRVLCDKKVLIVLDDVDGKEQLESLAGKGNWFGSGSRIIITTRDQSVLRIEEEAIGEGPVEKPAKVLTYEMCEMEFDDALKLFSKHAFRRDFPPDYYVSLSKDVVSTLGRLPLALVVTGSSLNSEPKEFWEATLKKLKDAPPDKVLSKLMISYEKLDRAQRQVFLDIACFFVHKDITYPFYMWDACGYHPHVVTKVLFLKSLIKIKDDNTFWMHDQVRDLGREIVHRENKEPCERSRVWKCEEALSILKQKEGSGKIEALSAGYNTFLPKTVVLKHDEFANLPNLQFFQGYGVNLVGDFNSLLSHLRWLSCLYFFKFEATNFHPTNLVVLNLSHSNISDESIGWIKAVRKLKVLDLNHCNNLRKPDFSTLVSLERLRLCGCKKMKKLPDSVGKLQSLVELDLLWTGVGHLPNSFNNLKQLTILRMSDTVGGITKLPSAIWLVEPATGFLGEGIVILKIPDLTWTQISTLSTLSCTQISTLRTLSRTLHPFSRRKSFSSYVRELLGYRYSKQSRGLPSSSFPLKGTTVGKLEDVTALPTSLIILSRLKKLALASRNSRFLLQLPSSLRKLVLRDLATTELSDFSNLEKDPNLKFYWRSMLVVSGVFDAELEKPHMQDCTFRRLHALLHLKRKRLSYLRLLWCDSPSKGLEPSRMKNLQEVDLFECKSLVEIRSLEELGSLSSLIVRNCSSTEGMSDLSKLRKLSKLRVGKCPKLRSVEGLNHLESLKCLWIHDCDSLESFADTSNLDLQCFQIVRCEQFRDRCNYCKHGSGCYCEMLFERSRKSNPMKDPQVLRGPPDVALVRKSEHDLVVVLSVTILFVFIVLFCLRFCFCF